MKEKRKDQEENIRGKMENTETNQKSVDVYIEQTNE